MAATKTKKPAAEKPAKETKPASKKPAAQEKPATQKAEGGVGITELAADLGKNPRAVRAQIRRFKGGAQVGQGGRYRWDSKQDPEYKELLDEFSAKAEEETE